MHAGQIQETASRRIHRPFQPSWERCRPFESQRLRRYEADPDSSNYQPHQGFESSRRLFEKGRLQLVKLGSSWSLRLMAQGILMLAIFHSAAQVNGRIDILCTPKLS
jgi:hypothetical protein